MKVSYTPYIVKICIFFVIWLNLSMATFELKIVSNFLHYNPINPELIKSTTEI